MITPTIMRALLVAFTGIVMNFDQGEIPRSSLRRLSLRCLLFYNHFAVHHHPVTGEGA